MSIPARCDSCGKKFMLPEHLAGRTLPCKACGEPLTVEGEELSDDFEARPRRAAGSRRAAQPRRSVAAARPRRRRKSGASIPRWIFPVLGGLVGVAAIVVAVVLFLPTLATTHESLQRDAIAELNDVGEMLEGVQDPAAAQAAAASLQASGERLFEIYREAEELRKTDPMTEEQEAALRKSLQRDRIRALDRVNKQTRRIADDPQLAAILREPISQFVERTREGEKERRRRELDDWVDRQEQAREKARQAYEADRAAREQQQQAQTPDGAVAPGSPAPGQVPAYVPGGRPGFQPPAGYLPPGARLGPPGGRPPFAAPTGPDVVSVEMPRPQNFTDVRSRLREIAGKTNHFHTMTVNGQSTVTIAPVADVQAFAAMIDFGQVEVDSAARRIIVTPDEAYTFRPGAGQSMQPAASEEKITVGSTFVHERLGPNRVAALALRGISARTPQELIKARVDEARMAAGETESIITSWDGRGTHAMFVVGPVADFNAFAAALDIGQVASTDPAQRLLVINVDAAKLRPEPKRVSDAELELSTNLWPGNGPHGGKMIPVNGGEFQVEAWMDQKTGNLVVWFSDRNGQPVAVAGNSLTVNIKRPVADLPLRTFRAPLPSDPEDASSRFIGNLPEVEGARQRGIAVELHVPFGGKTHIVRL